MIESGDVVVTLVLAFLAVFAVVVADITKWMLADPCDLLHEPPPELPRATARKVG